MPAAATNCAQLTGVGIVIPAEAIAVDTDIGRRKIFVVAVIRMRSGVRGVGVAKASSAGWRAPINIRFIARAIDE